MTALLRGALFICCLGPVSATAALPETLAQALKNAGIAPANVALWVAPANGGAPSLQHNVDEAFNPASVMKLVTSSAAIELLGPGYTWRTEALLRGPLQGGVLQGDLVLRGGGDPALTWDRFGSFLRDLRARGLREIRGNVLLDRSLFAPIVQDNFDDQPQRAYNAAPDALLVNFKAISVRLTPAAARQPIAAVSLVPLAPFNIDNQLVASSGGCGDWRGQIQSELLSQGEGFVLRLAGSMPASCGERVLNLAAHDGPRLAASVFRALWAELGGRLDGTVREGTTPPDATPFANWQSPTLVEVLRDINKYSNNVMARHLLLTLGRSDTQAQGLTPQMGVQRIRDWLANRQTALPGLVLENGSGLSRHERISAAGLGNLLQSMWQSPRMPDLVATLPIAGEDGTARRRFSGQPSAGRAYLKTGSLNDVMSTAGYVQDARGQWQVVVLMITGPRAEAGEAATLAALRVVAEAAPATSRLR
ncbi:D-alanyl-D-alanine carboxypeptidase/D-alanyl-D-alanine endopeptidase [Viridibacterium curvum]